jgi:hypothetical protein
MLLSDASNTFICTFALCEVVLCQGPCKGMTQSPLLSIPATHDHNGILSAALARHKIYAQG